MILNLNDRRYLYWCYIGGIIGIFILLGLVMGYSVMNDVEKRFNLFSIIFSYILLYGGIAILLILYIKMLVDKLYVYFENGV